MPAPNASFILSMLNPYEGFDPNKGAQVAIAAGQLGEQRAGRRQRAGEFKLENERANSYLNLQQQQFANKQANDLRDRQIDAFGKFNDAIVNGDDEQAAFWGQQLQGSGVQVEEYSGPQAGPAAPPGSPAPHPKVSAMDAYGPYAMSPEQKKTVDTELGITVDEPAEAAPMEAPSVRPKPARATEVASAPEPSVVIPRSGQGTNPAPLTGVTLPTGDPVGTGVKIPPQETTTSPSDAASSETNFPTEVGGDKYDPKTGNRIPPGMNEAEAAAQPPQRGYRLHVGGRTIDIRPEDIRARQEERVRGTLAGLTSGAKTPEEKRAAQAANEAAVKAIPIYGVKGATKIGIEHYEQELERGGALNRAKYAAAGRQVSVGFNKEDTMRQGGVADDIETMVKGFEQNDEVRMARASVANSDRILGMVKSNNSIAEWAAQQGVLKEFVKGVASDRDLSGFLGSMGRPNQILKELNAWFEGGAMPEDINRKVGELAVETRRFYDKKLAATADRAANYFEGNSAITSRMTPEEVQKHKRNIYYRISGRQMPEPKGQTGGGAKPSGGASPAKPGAPAKGSAQSRADALKKRLMGK